MTFAGALSSAAGVTRGVSLDPLNSENCYGDAKLAE